MTIVFEVHGTTFDNEAHLSSGHFDVELSPLGIKQAKELGARYKDQEFDAIFCSDFRRSYRTAEIAFGNKFPIVKDNRLRECDYGDLTRNPSDEVEPQKLDHISKPFPNGESYEQTSKRMKEFLDDLRQKYHDRDINVLIIGHRATQYGLEHWINGIDLKTLVSTPFKWQPGWSYTI
ncbi:MAG: histidine phosphatase family protein [Candidatus Daviesbacteria bacterium]|nr:histidine phosphatase family protein [Candidatus Daviesbacteria bacterium]